MTIPAFIKTSSADETRNLGKDLAQTLSENPELPRFVAMFGDLGVGKTAFVNGFITSLIPDARVKSPTFALVHEYRAATPIFHFDMYRIEDEDELESIGFYDYFDRRGFMLCEWCENIPYALPEKRIEVTIAKDDLITPDSRTISVKLT